MQNPFWTGARVALLRRMVDDGKEDAEIGAIFDRSRTAIGKARKRFGLPTMRELAAWTEDEIQTLKSHFRSGKTDQHIAGVLGRTARVVKKKRIELGHHRINEYRKTPVQSEEQLEEELVVRNRKFLRALTRAHPERAKAILRGENTDYFGRQTTTKNGSFEQISGPVNRVMDRLREAMK